jgi:hypothetical protein
MFKAMCMKPACKKMAVMNLRTIGIGKHGSRVDLPPPLIWLLAMEASMTTEFLDCAELIWWISSVVKT